MTEQTPMNCEEALRLLAEHLDGELEQWTRAEVDAHLRRCRSCFSRAEFEKQLKNRIAGLHASDVPTPFEVRVRALIDRFADPQKT